ARHQGHSRAGGGGMGPRGEVGRRTDARGGRGGLAEGPPHHAQRQRRDHRVARRPWRTDGRARPPRRRRDHRPGRAGAPRLRGHPGAHARPLGHERCQAGAPGAGDVHGLRRAAPRRPRPDRPAARRAARGAGGPRPGVVAGAADVRRRADAPGRHAPAGRRGHRLQAALLAVRVRRALPALAEVRPPAPVLVRRRWLAAAGRHQGPAGLAAGGRADARGADVPGQGRQRHRRSRDPAAHRPARRSRSGAEPVRRRGARRRRARHVLGRAVPGRRRRRAQQAAGAAAAPAVVPRRAGRPRPRRPAPGRGGTAM
ncbi:MAG: DNA_ligase_IV_Ku-like, partial [uncultured Nocardioides sp.]